jgi:hypothetical protein
MTGTATYQDHGLRQPVNLVVVLALLVREPVLFAESEYRRAKRIDVDFAERFEGGVNIHSFPSLRCKKIARR